MGSIDLVRTRWNLSGVEVDDVANGGMYGNFADRDASQGMAAKQPFDLGMFWILLGCITQLPSLGNIDPDRPTSGQAGGPPSAQMKCTCIHWTRTHVLTHVPQRKHERWVR